MKEERGREREREGKTGKRERRKRKGREKGQGSVMDKTYVYKCNRTRLHTVFSCQSERVCYWLWPGYIPGEELQAKGWGHVKLCGSHEIESVPSDVQKVQPLPTILNTCTGDSQQQ